MILKACIVCAKPSTESYCTEHKPKAWATSKRKARVGLSGSAEQRRAKRILDRYLHCCHVCGNPGADQVDHVTPLAEGGADEEWNLAPIHAEPCHREKTAAEAKRARRGVGSKPRTVSAQGPALGAGGARRSQDKGGLTP